MKSTDKPPKADSYSIGYGKPPAHSRFRKGHSGNPKGRPKGTFNTATLLERELREPVIVNENGERNVISKLEAALKQVTNKAASGDLKAFQILFQLRQAAEERVESPEPTTLSENDQKVVQGILDRYNASNARKRK